VDGQLASIDSLLALKETCPHECHAMLSCATLTRLSNSYHIAWRETRVPCYALKGSVVNLLTRTELLTKTRPSRRCRPCSQPGNG
jgi:hypothetical protein